MKLGFVPDRRNLGGKRDIDNLQKNHLLALINAKSQLNNKTPPFQPVAHQKKKRQKSLGQIQIEFREVYESQKRVLQMKKGGIDNSQPVCFERKFFIKNRACIAKDIETQDHRRNLMSLSKRLTDVDLQSEKNKLKMKEEQQKQQFLQSKYQSRHDHSLFQSSSEAYSALGKKRPQSASVRSFVKGLGQSQRQSIDYSQFQSKKDIVPVNYAYKNKSSANLNAQKNQSHLVSMDYSEVLIGEDTTQNQSKSQLHNPKKSYLDSKEDILANDMTNSNNMNPELDLFIKENYGGGGGGEEEDVEYLYQKNRSENSIQYSDIQQTAPQQHNRKHTHSKNASNHTQNQAQSQKPQPIQQAIPFITVTSNNDPYTDLRRSLLNVIMDYKLYDKEQMMDLASLVKKKNPHLDLQQIQAVCKHIIIRLYGEF